MTISNNLKAGSLANIWMVLLLLSFSYDKALIQITPYDRFNPRLFDIATILGIIWYLNLKHFKLYPNKVFTSYKKIILWFAVCVILGLFLYPFPMHVNLYSLYFLLRYFQELLVLYFVLIFISKYEINYDSLFKILILGGVFVSIYCFIEYQNPVEEVFKLANGDTLIKPPGFIWGPFTASYFQIANYSPIIGLLTVSYALKQQVNKQWFYLLISLFVLWPSLYSGSRTGVGFVFIMFLIAAILEVRYRKIFIVVLLLVIVFFIFNYSRLNYLLIHSDNETIQRTIELQAGSGHDSISTRFQAFFTWFKIIPSYIYSGIFLPFIGAGFYVAPIDGYFRIGYGWHNIFIFVIEQAGVVGLWLFFKFLFKTYKVLKKAYNQLSKQSAEYWFKFTVYIIFLSIILTGVSGAHVFWRGFATGNFNSFRLIILLIAAQPKSSYSRFLRLNYEKNIVDK